MATALQAGVADVALGLGLGLVGFALAGYGVVRHRRQRARIERSEPVRATVTGVAVTESEGVRDVEDGGQHTDRKYSTDVSFEYTYDGETYEVSNRYPDSGAVSTKWDARQAAEDHVEAFDEGNRVTAHVDPERSGEAFLEATPTWGRNATLVAFGVLFGGGQLAAMLLALGVL
jgi:hypothetical protein